MKEKTLLFKIWLFITIVGAFGLTANGQATLKHSYTFEEGTYDETTVFDQVGTVNGTLGGTKISIADGKATVSGATVNSDGWISLDGVALALNSYSAVTLEAFVETGELLNTGYTMLAYFGTSTPGNRCFWIQPTRAGNETRIEANNGSTTVTALLGGYEVDDGKKHHIVAILNNEALTYYLDGVIIAQTPTGADFVSTLGTDVANLFRGVDGWNDPNYNASLLEFNIYDGTLDQHTIAQTAGEFLGLDLTNPNLENLTTSVGTMEPAYDPGTDIYEITVPYGTTSLTLNADPVVGGVTIKMFDGLGNELQNGAVNFDKDDGIDVEIEVTALDGYTKKSYYVSVFPEAGESSATLAGITLSAGAFTTAFNMYDTAYVAIVPSGTTAVDVTGVPNWNNATVSGNGTVTLVDGVGTATLTVTSEDASASMVYTVEIHTSVFAPNTDFYIVHEVNEFVAAESGAAFNQVILQDAVYNDSLQIWHFEDSGVAGQYYIVNKAGHYMCLSRTSANVWDLEVYSDLPTVGLDSARFSLNEFEPGRFRIISVRRQQVHANNFRLGPNNGDLGSPLYSDKWRSEANDPLTVFNLKPANDKTVASPYEVHLASLSLNGVSIKPAFNPAYRKYFATIPAGWTTVDVTATPENAAASVSGTGTVDVSGGTGTITVTVTAAEDASYSKSYVINYISDTELTLTHSYTFSDGTANDQVGDADGTVHGGTFADDSFVSAKEGDYIILPAKDLALNTYPSITLEAHVTTGVNPAWTMLAYFGGSSGTNSYWISIARNDNVSRTEINTGGSVFANGDEPGPGQTHYYVSVLSNDSIFWYIDGELAAKTQLANHSMISKISTAGAWLAYGGYNDPTWIGSIHEFNIYSGQMDAATVAERAKLYLGDISHDATLSSLTVDEGELIPAFDPDITTYSVVIPSGVTTINVSAVANDDKATVEGTGPVDVSSGSGSASVVVTAEDGYKTKTYSIQFSAPTEYTLMHSYTFNDGTANDQVGTAHGVLMGAGTIANGAYTAAANGDYIELPAADIAINTYPAITLEGYIYTDVDNTGATMMAYFGGNENGLGGNGYFLTPDRWAESRTAISCGNITAPWSAEQGVTGPAVSVGEKHHVVSVLTDAYIKWYIDGVLIGEAEVSGANSIAGISDAHAWLCKGGYESDPTWLGTIDEFNIYSGVMDAATIAQHAKKYLGGLVLTHSYTFEDGTANDVVGSAHGTLEGDASVANGKLNLTGNGFVTLPAEEINVPSYSRITIEGVITQAEGITGAFTAFASFGDVNPSVDWMGINYIILQPTRQDNENSRTSISCLNTNDPWATENGVNGAEIADTETHHWVTVITETEIKLYIDGMLVGTDSLTGNNALANVGNSVALIGKDVYPGDPLWQGTIEELNIYAGEMDAETVAERANHFLGGGLTLMHSYTFEDGTANDMVGDADGTLEGDAAVSEGKLHLTGNGFVTLPAGMINVPAYSTITFEGVIKQAEGITGAFTAFASFGDVNPSVDWMGINYIILQPTRQDNENSRTSISCLNTNDPWATENGVNGAEIADTKTHHWVTVVTDAEIKLYIDGVLVGTDSLTGNNALANVGNSVALLGKDVYPGDPLWQGTIEEFNIYAGEMDAATIAARAGNFTTGIPAESLNDAFIRVYPTYTENDFKVETGSGRGMITVYNLLGKKVAQKIIENTVESVTVNERGMYILHVESDGAVKSFKVFKTR